MSNEKIDMYNLYMITRTLRMVRNNMEVIIDTCLEAVINIDTSKSEYYRNSYQGYRIRQTIEELEDLLKENRR